MLPNNRRTTAKTKTTSQSSILASWILTLAFSVVFNQSIVFSLTVSESSKIADAKYQQTIKEYTQLQKSNSVSFDDWEKVIVAFTQIKTDYPNYHQAPKSLFKLGEIYSMLANKNNQLDFKDKAAQSYQELIDRYPNQEIALNAEANLAKIYERQDKNNIVSSEQKTELQLQPKAQLLSIERYKSLNADRIILRLSQAVKFNLKKPTEDNAKLIITLADSNPSDVSIKAIEHFKNLAIFSEKNAVSLQLTIPKNNSYDVYPFENNNQHSLVIDVFKSAKTDDLNLAAGTGNSNESVKNKFSVADLVDELKPLPKKLLSRVTLSKALGLKIKKIVLDPGHGGKDPGAVSYGIYEKDLALKTAKMIEMELLNMLPGVSIDLTRRDDRYLPLEERSEFANNQKADLFISIHFNAHKNKEVAGIESYFLDLNNDQDVLELAARENYGAKLSVNDIESLVQNVVKDNKSSESQQFATIVQQSMISNLSLDNHNPENMGVKRAPFIVLIGTKMPSILLELGFMSNQDEIKLLKTDGYLKKLARATAVGIAGYVNWNQPTVNYAQKN